MVRRAKETASPLSIKSGVPQGSLLEPVLYLLCTVDLPTNKNNTAATSKLMLPEWQQIRTGKLLLDDCNKSGPSTFMTEMKNQVEINQINPRYIHEQWLTDK